MITINNEMVMNEGMYNVIANTMMYKDSSIGYEMMMNPNMEVQGRMNLLISLLDKNANRQLGVGVFTQVADLVKILRSINVTTITSDDMFAIIAHVCNIVSPISNKAFANKTHKSKIINIALKDFKAAVDAHNNMSNMTTEPVVEEVAGFAKVKEELPTDETKTEEPKEEKIEESKDTKVVYKPVKTIKDLRENLAKGRGVESDVGSIEYVSIMEELIKDMKDDEGVDEDLYNELTNKAALKRVMSELKKDVKDDEIMKEVMEKFSGTINKMINHLTNNSKVPYDKETTKELNDIKGYVEKRLSEKVAEIVEDKPKSATEFVESFKTDSKEVLDMVISDSATKKDSNYDKAKASIMEKMGNKYNSSMDAQIHEYATMMAKTMDNIDRINSK